MTGKRSYLRRAFLLGVCLCISAPFALDVRTSVFQPAPKKPDDNRFTPVVLVPPGELDEPMAFEVARDGRVFIIERKGAFKVFDPLTKTTSVIATIPVNTKYVSAAGVSREAEEGLVGFTIDPNFEQNHWVYMLYADPQVAKHTLARWELREVPGTPRKPPELVDDSKKVVLEYSVQRETCCHTGGGMVWDKAGNLFLTVGNNTGNVLQMQSDERPGRVNWDDQRGASNTNDLRGKILRIHPEPDATYTIPQGNLFPANTANTRPEIYVMGTRNAWRVSIDSKTGYLYWGEVGPDASEDTRIGPMGYDEFNQARKPGYFGWPYFIGENRGYPYYDYFKDTPVEPKDPNKPVNTSVNNSGLRELPPAQPAFIAYPYSPSEKFPEVGTGGRSATGGPVYRRADFPKAARPFPDYYEGKWLAADLARGWIMAISMNEQGDYQSMERFLPGIRWSEIIDIKFGSDGDLYVLDYGSTWFAKSADSQLVRIEYNGGNRAPVVSITADRTGGSAPLKVALSSAGTKDYDGDQLKYEWTVESAAGGEPKTHSQPNPTITFDKPGVYTATLTVTDPAGASGTGSVDIIAGNEPPRVAITVAGANKTFFTPDGAIDYTIQVSDKEDGVVPPERVAVSVDYVPEGFDVTALKEGQRPVDPTTRFAFARALIARSDCATCHNRDKASRGPTFMQLAEKYKPDAATLEQLATRIRTGSTKVWGDEVMPPHPLFSVHEAKAMAEYMLNAKEASLSAHPLQGSYKPALPEDDPGRGSVVIRAVYTDKGAKDLPPLTTEAMTVLRSTRLGAAAADVQNGVVASSGRGSAGVLPRNKSYIGFKGVDLAGVKKAELAARAEQRSGNVGGTIEVRLDSPTGPMVGQAAVNAPGAAPSGPTATDIQAAGGAGRGRGRGGPAPVSIELKESRGVHDVYFVFRNEKATGTQPLMTVSTVRFVME